MAALFFKCFFFFFYPTSKKNKSGLHKEKKHLSFRYKKSIQWTRRGNVALRSELWLCPSPGGHPGSGDERRVKWEGHQSTGTDFTASSPLSLCTYYVLSGTNLLGELTALHRAEVQVLVEEFSIQDVSHSVLQASSVRVQHSGPET